MSTLGRVFSRFPPFPGRLPAPFGPPEAAARPIR